MDKQSFVLYTSYYDILKDLSNEHLGLLFRTILEYTNSNEPCIQVPNEIKIAFNFIKNQLDLDNKKYEQYIEKQKANGCKGGRPKSQKTHGFFEKPNETQRNLNDNVNDNVNVKEKDKSFSLIREKEKNSDIFFHPVKEFFLEEFEKIFNRKPYISKSELDRLIELQNSNQDFNSLLPIVLEKLKKLRFKDISFTPSATWLLKGSNFEKLANGEFDKNLEEKETFDFTTEEGIARYLSQKRKKEGLANG